jgi:hypothetical protein
MTNTQRLALKPGPVVEVIKMWAVKLSLDHKIDNDAQWDEWIGKALQRWEADYERQFQPLGLTETRAAEMIVETMRANPKYGWSRILRAGTN